jgi:hypothetical protein
MIMYHVMWDKEVSGTPIDRLVQTLRQRLPTGWKATLTRSEAGGLDGILEVKEPDGSAAAFAVAQKRRLDPRDVPRAVLQLQGTAGGRPLLFVAPFLGPRTRALLRDAGASYGDATGNARLVLERPAVFIEAQGSDRDPRRQPPALENCLGSCE